MVGVVDGILVDRAFIAERAASAAELCTIADLASPAPHIVANALAAAALARAHGVPPGRGPRRAARLPARRPPDRAGGRPSTGVDLRRRLQGDQPARGAASLQAYDPVVWVAGGLAKGARFDDLVAAAADRLRGAVLLGARPGGDRRGPRATRARCPGHRGRRRRDWHRTCRHGRAVVRRGASWPARATRCCWPRRAPRWTCSRNYADRGDAFAAAVQD